MRLVCVECGAAHGPAPGQPQELHPSQAQPAEVAPTDATCPTCRTVLEPPTAFDCARLGLLPELQMLVCDLAFDVNALEPASQATILHHAALNSKMRIIDYLLTEPKWKDVLLIDALGGELQTTPLFWASYHNHIYAVELLLAHGANAFVRDPSGYTPFLLAIQRGFPILAAYLVSKGTDINDCVADGSQTTALMLLCHRQRFHLDTFRMVLSLQATLDAQDKDGNTALHYAVKHDIGMAVRMLLDRGATPALVNRDGYTPLALALQRLSPKSEVRHLLKEDSQLHWVSTISTIPKKTLQDNVYKLTFFVPWVFLPTFASIVISTNGFFWIMLKLTALVTATVLSLHVLRKGAYGDKRKAAALMFGINVASVAWLVGCYPTFAWEHCSIVFHTTMLLSVFGLVFCLYKTATMNPGVIVTSYEEKLFNIRSLVESKSPSATKLCLTCLHRRPLRAKHCAESDACIARFDHYCPFVNNAIGAENHTVFWGFLFFCVVSINLELIACWRFTANQLGTIVWARGVFVWLWSIAHFHPLLFCVVLLDLLQIIWIGYLLGFQTYLMLVAVTTNEFVKNENPTRAYSRGFVRNCIDFFRLDTLWRRGHKEIKDRDAVDWTQIYSLDEFHDAIGNFDDHVSIETRKSV